MWGEGGGGGQMRMGIAAGNVLGLLVLHINFLSFEIDETLRGNLSSLYASITHDDYSSDIKF